MAARIQASGNLQLNALFTSVPFPGRHTGRPLRFCFGRAVGAGLVPARVQATGNPSLLRSFRKQAFPGRPQGSPLRFCLIKGAYSLPCVRGGGSAAGGDERVAPVGSRVFGCAPLSGCAANPGQQSLSLAAARQLPLLKGAFWGGAAEFPGFPLFFPFPFLQRRMFYVIIINRSITLL